MNSRASMFPVGLLLFTACAVNPATGKRQLMLVSEGEETQLGARYNDQTTPLEPGQIVKWVVGQPLP